MVRGALSFLRHGRARSRPSTSACSNEWPQLCLVCGVPWLETLESCKTEVDGHDKHGHDDGEGARRRAMKALIRAPALTPHDPVFLPLFLGLIALAWALVAAW